MLLYSPPRHITVNGGANGALPDSASSVQLMDDTKALNESGGMTKHPTELLPENTALLLDVGPANSHRLYGRDGIEIRRLILVYN